MVDDSGPYAGQRSDVPPVRARTPSPVRQVLSSSVPPAPARDLVIEPSKVDIIYAEDETVFREATIMELLKVGFARENIYEAENGMEALEHLARLQLEGHCELPLLVLLDVRMPTMDGRECALQIQELVKKKQLRREPFTVCISSVHRQVTVDEGKGNFQVVLRKPVCSTSLAEALEFMRKWWTLGYGRSLAAWKAFDTGQIDAICADVEPVCRLATSMAFTKAGVRADAVQEIDEPDELVSALLAAQEGNPSRPLLVLLGVTSWAPLIHEFVDSPKRMQGRRRREPFVVCTSVDSDRIGGTSGIASHFHAFLPSRTLSQADVTWCLEFCRLWWQTRGEPDLGDSSSEEDGESICSD